MFEGICETIHHELDVLEDKFQDGNGMSESELDHIDKMVHTLKNIAAYEAMRADDGGGSYAKVRRYRRY